MRFIYAKCGGERQDSFDVVSDRFRADIEVVRHEFEKIWINEVVPTVSETVVATNASPHLSPKELKTEVEAELDHEAHKEKEAENAPIPSQETENKELAECLNSNGLVKLLSLPKASLKLHHFSARGLPLLGREKECKTLHEFLNSPKSFCWMQIAGAGGQGKSRLALELILDARKNGWDAGFVHPSDIPSFVSIFVNWQPTQPTLIVVDYVIGYEDELGDVLNLLSSFERLNFPVRFVVVERQRWDSGFNLINKAHEGVTSNPGTGIADWFAKATRLFDIRTTRFARTCYETPVIELDALSSHQLNEITIGWAKNRGISIGKSAGEIADTLAHIDPSGRPLYAYFLAEAFIAGYDTQGWSRENLLSATLTRDQIHQWAPHFGNDPPTLCDDHAALDMAVLATLSGGVLFSEVQGLEGWTRLSSKTKKQTLALVGDPIGIGITSSANGASRLEPDILGGWFVLEWIKQAGRRSAWMITSAWKNSPKETAATILRCAQDFPNHSSIADLLKVPTPSGEAERAYVEIASSLLVSLRSKIDKYHKEVLPRIEIAAFEGDVRAISRLGFCYQNGMGTNEPDLKQAYEWFRKGAELNDGRCMAYLGHWYLVGQMGTPDYAKALEWFKLGAENGDGHAMGYVGVCHHNGIGVVQDHEKGVRWFKRGCEAGDGASWVYLGVCLLEGTGIEPNDDKAFSAFKRGDEMGSNHALAYLGQMYLQGRGVSQNHDLAIRYLRDGVAIGSALAHAFLGYCYRDGIGFDRPDLDLALEHLEKGVAGKSGAAMYFLGECYHFGLGVKHDPNRSRGLWRQAAQFGDVLAKAKLAKLNT